MNTSAVLLPAKANAFAPALSVEQMRRMAPAVFAESAHVRMSGRYAFIQTSRVLDGLLQAGFVAVEARQAQSRRGSVLHARHLIRLRRRFETVTIDDVVPEVVFLNSHDGSSAYQLRVGMFRLVCENGLIISTDVFPAIRVAHRRDVVDEAIAAAIQVSERFEEIGGKVEEMRRRVLTQAEQLAFAEQAVVLRFRSLATAGFAPSKLLLAHRVEDVGDDLWRTFNRIQENVLRGGVRRRTSAGRLVRTRCIRSIAEDVRLNGALWEVASRLLAQ